MKLQTLWFTETELPVTSLNIRHLTLDSLRVVVIGLSVLVLGF